MSIRCLLVSVVTCLAAVTYVHAKTVIFHPPPLTSYVVYHTNVAVELASIGHDVWISLPHFMVQRNMVKDKSVKIIEYGKDLGDIEFKVYGSTAIVETFWAGEPRRELEALYAFCLEFIKLAPEILSEKSFIDKVRSLKPDLYVIESVPFAMNMIVIPYMFDIPFALIGTVHDVILSKVPFSPGTMPIPLSMMTDRMTFFQRVKATLICIARMNFDLFYDSNLVSRFAPHKPYKSISEIASNAEIFIAEVDHILDYPRTMLPNTKLVGGSSASPAKPLIGDFKKFVDNSKNGIIVFTFGGSIVDVPPHITSKLISAFKQLDLGVVWKVNITSPDPSRIMTSKWIPQNDILGHNKTKLFISHCGKNGQYEALYHAVPILCFPIYGDQGYNSERIKVKELGLYADIRESSADELASMMKQIIYDGKYTNNMKKASDLYRKFYKVPKKEAAFWLDHVMEYGGAYMRSAGQQMPWYQIYVLDVLAFLFIIIVITLLFIYFLIKQCWKFCRGNTSVKIKAKNQ